MIVIWWCKTHRSPPSPQGDDPQSVCLARLTDKHDQPGVCEFVDLTAFPKDKVLIEERFDENWAHPPKALVRRVALRYVTEWEPT